MPNRLLALLVVVNEFLTENSRSRLCSAQRWRHLGHLFGDIARPAFCCVEGDDANGIAVLALEQMPKEGFEIGVSWPSSPGHRSLASFRRPL
jgi:hypothetical protein